MYSTHRWLCWTLFHLHNLHIQKDLDGHIKKNKMLIHCITWIKFDNNEHFHTIQPALAQIQTEISIENLQSSKQHFKRNVHPAPAQIGVRSGSHFLSYQIGYINFCIATTLFIIENGNVIIVAENISVAMCCYFWYFNKFYTLMQ